MSYAAIEKGEPADRVSVVLFYLKTGQGPECPMYVPSHHEEMIGAIVRRLGLSAEITDPPGDTGSQARRNWT